MSIDNKPCILEYSEEQNAWHHNTGGNEIASNGYQPMAVGSVRGICNLTRIVHEREGNQRLSTKEANDLVFRCIYDFTELLPDVHYIPLKWENK